MATINGAKWRSSKGADWYFQFQYTNTINGRICTTNWELWLKTSSNDTQHVASGCTLTKNGTTLATVPREHHYQNTKFSSGSFTTSLDSAGKGSFSIRIHSSIYYGTWQDVDATINITGGWNNVGATTITITDNGNNTFSLSGSTPSNTLNNTIQKCEIYYTTNGSTPSMTNGTKIIAATSSSTPFNFVIAIKSGVTVKAKSYTIATHNTAESTVSTRAIVYYGPPAQVQNVKLNYTGKFTKNSNAYFSWNASSGAAGYWIYLEVKKKQLTWASEEDLGNTTAYTLTAEDKANLDVGDIVTATITAYRLDGTGAQIPANSTVSPQYVVQNAAILNCKINGVWKACTPWIKVNGVWKQATGAFTKVNGSWKASK